MLQSLGSQRATLVTQQQRLGSSQLQGIVVGSSAGRLVRLVPPGHVRGGSSSAAQPRSSGTHLTHPDPEAARRAALSLLRPAASWHPARTGQAASRAPRDDPHPLAWLFIRLYLFSDLLTNWGQKGGRGGGLTRSEASAGIPALPRAWAPPSV